MFPTGSTSAMFHETRRAPDRTEFELSEESTRLPSTVDAQISAVPRQPLFCGSQQPFTGEISDEPGSSTDLLHISLGLDDSTPQRKQMARRSSGCGEKVHSSAVPRSQLWSADVRGVAATVIPLDAQYVPQEVAAILDGPHREGCGCSSGFVGCAVCGNPLGDLFMPCNTHTLPNFEGIYTFVGSAVSPSNPNSFHPSAQLHERAAYSHPEHVAFRPSPQLRRVPRAPPPLDRSAVERALAQHPAARRIDLLHRSANSVTEPRRAPRAPPPLPDDDIDRIWSYLHERVAEHAESASSLTPLHSTSSAASLALGHPTRVPRAPPPLPRSTVTGPRSHLAAISPSASAIGAAQTSEQLLAIQMDRIRAATLRLAELDDAAEERAGEDSTYMPLPRWTLPPGATTRVLRVGQRTGGGSAGLDVDAAEYAEARRLGRDA